MKFLMFFASLLFSVPVAGQGYLKQYAKKATENQLFTVVVSSIDSFENWASRQQIQIVDTYRPANIVVLRSKARVFREKILQNPQVRYAAPASGQPQPELPVPGQNLFVNKINVAQHRFPSLNGSGAIISIREFKFDPLDVDLQNRVLESPAASPSLTTHAAIVASLTAGAGNSDPAGAGAAPGCLLLSSGYGSLLPEENYATLGVTVQNHSYGVEIENFYGPNAYAYDISTVENPQLLHVFSAGNKGAESSEAGAYANIAGFANLTGNFKMAKNVLTVGAVDSMGVPTFFSSRGPAFDGRIKPDLVAFGLDGTSGAAALVAGAAGVLQQAYKEKYDTLPGSEMLRALLMHSADDMGEPGPDFASGFGNLNLKNAIQTVLNSPVVTAVVSSGATVSIPVDLPVNTRQVKITLVWNDVPAQPGAVKALVHDLDLRLLGPGGQIWLPWVPNAAPDADSLRLPAVRTRDTLNNVEQITLESPPPGSYQIQVFGAAVAGGIQPFSLVYDWDHEGHFEWTYPVRDDPAVAASEVVLRWETRIDSAFGRLEWKPAGAANWRLLDSTVQLSAGLKRWFIPDTFSEAQVRMQAGAQTFVSDTFLIAKTLRLSVGFNCPDSVGLFWNKSAEHADYLLYGLGQRYLEPLFMTRDTFLVLQKNMFPQQRFAIAPLGPGRRILGRRSAAPDIGSQGLNCYQKSFFAEINAAKQVDISLLLGTVYGVAKVQIEKWHGDRFEPLVVYAPADQTQYGYTDVQPVQGKNIYRAVLFTTNGALISGDTATVYFTGEKDWLVFPNPLLSGGVLQVLSNGSGEAGFKLFDALGRIILNKKLDDDHIEISIPSLPQGIYFFQTQENGKQLWSGRLIVQ